MKNMIVVAFVVFGFSSALIACDATEKGAEEEKVIPASNADTGSGEENTAKLPREFQSDFPFPEDAALRIIVNEGTGANQYVASFTFFNNVDQTYRGIKQYIVNRGFNIKMENSNHFSFIAKRDSDSITVHMSNSDSVHTGTVTFIVHSE